jgi:hypothetical protein
MKRSLAEQFSEDPGLGMSVAKVSFELPRHMRLKESHEATLKYQSL